MRNKWTKEKIEKEALKYDSRTLFKQNSGSAYNAAVRMGILEEVCLHIPNKTLKYEGKYNPNFKYLDEDLVETARLFSSRNEFAKKFPSQYKTARERNILDAICSHMPDRISHLYDNNPNFKYLEEVLQAEALKYQTRAEFKKNSPKLHRAATRRGILNKICTHMKWHRGHSSQENELFKLIKEKYPSSKKYRDNKVSIPNKPYIKGFEIDIFIPELRKGIEFDGKYYHSFDRMRSDKRKRMWSNEDILNYHTIKDKYFLSKEIKILHIKEEDWIKNKERCVENALLFLNNS